MAIVSDDAQKLLRETIVSLSCVGDPVLPGYFPTLRIVCESGRLFELAATIENIHGASEIFQVEVHAVGEFSSVEKWPAGPAVDWRELEVVSSLLGKSAVDSLSIVYSDQGFLEGKMVAGRSGLELRHKNGVLVSFTHGGTPGGLNVQVGHHAAI